MGDIYTINSLSYDETLKRRWECELIRRNGTLLEFVGVFDREVRHPHLGRIEKGTYSHEFYWLDRCYNVFRFHRPDGTFREFYCNINLPPVLGAGVLSYVDLDIDIVFDADDRLSILDEDEFESNALFFGYDESLRLKVTKAQAELLWLINNREFPFDHSG